MLLDMFGCMSLYIFFGFINVSQQTSNNTFGNITEAEVSSEEILDWDIWCKYQPNSYDCSGRGRFKSGFYYDVKMESCKAAEYGTCEENINQFGSIHTCNEQCRDSGVNQIKQNLSERVYCRLQHDFGHCNNYYPMWYFDISVRSCKGFSYSGCGGNHNRFHSAQICTAVCGGVIQY